MEIERTVLILLTSYPNIDQRQLNYVKGYIKEHLIHEYLTPLDYHLLLPNLTVDEYSERDIIYEQGEDIKSYYFLLCGKALKIRKVNGESFEQKQIIEGPSILGQYIHSHLTKREATVKIISSDSIILSVNKQFFHANFQSLISQYLYVLEYLLKFSSINQQFLQKNKLYEYSHLQVYRINEVVMPKQNYVYIITEGVCKMIDIFTHSKVIISKYNCIGVQQYLRKSNTLLNTYKYIVQSSCVKLIAVHFDFIDKMPERFIDQLTFISNAHSIPLKRNEKESTLPRLQRGTVCDKQRYIFNRQNKERQSHKINKCQSITDFKDNTKLQMNDFRKKYVLGFSPNKVPNYHQESAKKLTEPIGYFQISKKKETQGNSFEFQRRNWENYLKIKQKEKENNRHKHFGNLNIDLNLSRFKKEGSKKNKKIEIIFKKLDTFNHLKSVVSLDKGH